MLQEVESLVLLLNLGLKDGICVILSSQVVDLLLIAIHVEASIGKGLRLGMPHHVHLLLLEHELLLLMI